MHRAVRFCSVPKPQSPLERRQRVAPVAAYVAGACLLLAKPLPDLGLALWLGNTFAIVALVVLLASATVGAIALFDPPQRWRDPEERPK